MQTQTTPPRRGRSWRSGVVIGGLAVSVMGGFGAGYGTFAAIRPQPASGLRPHLIADTASQPLNSAGAMQAQGVLPNFVGLVEQVKPAVVSITTVLKPDAAQRAMGEQGRPILPFPFGPHAGSPHLVVEARGSGFIIDAKGTIVTNNHVIEGAQHVTVTLDSGKKLPARVIGHDARTDIAVLKVDTGTTLPYIDLGRSNAIKPGEWVVAMGNPFGLGGTVTHGIVSGLNRTIGKDSFDNFIQVDAPINRGNSGGPLFSQNGEVIGMDTAILSPSGGSIGIGFAIPSDTIRRVVSQLEQSGHVVRGFLGVKTEALLGSLASAMGVPPESGALVAAVLPDTPAAHAGMKPGDIITAVNGQRITGPHQLAVQVAGIQPGHEAKLMVQHRGQLRSVSLKVEQMPTQTASNAPLPQRDETDALQ